MKEDKSIFAKGKDNFWKPVMIAIVGIVVAGAISYAAWAYHKDFRNKDIALAQYQMMATAKATAISIQESIFDVQAVSYAIANDTLTQKGLSENIITPDIEQEIKETHIAHGKDVDTIYLLDSKGVILHRQPFWEDGKNKRGNSYADKPGVSHVLTKHEPYISKVFYTGSGKLTISVLSPVHYNNKFVGIVRSLINIRTISERFVKPIEVGQKGYAQLLNNRGILLWHPAPEHVGKNIIAIRKEKLPDFDWSELEDIVARMTSGEEGLGIYHSVWWTEKDHTKRVKKLTSFIPIRFGDQLWSIGLAMSYDEIAGPINKNAIITFGFAGILILLFSAGGFVFYKTQKKKAVLEAIAESAEALRESEEKLRAIFEAIADPVVMYDTQGHPQYLNPSFTQIFGWSLNELQGKRIPFVPDDQKNITGAKIKELYDFGKPIRVESKRLTKEGQILDVLISAALIESSDGESLGMVVNLTDITKRKALEAQLQHAQKLDSIGLLAGGMAHDFNNRLSIIMGNISMTKDDVKPEYGVTDFLNEAEEASLKAKELANQLITFSKGGAPVKEVRSIENLVKETTNLSMRGSNVKSEFSFPGDLWLVKFDKGQMKHAINNLVVDAVESMPDGGSIDIWTENFQINSETIEKGLPLPAENM